MDSKNLEIYSFNLGDFIVKYVKYNCTVEQYSKKHLSSHKDDLSKCIISLDVYSTDEFHRQFEVKNEYIS